MNVEATANSPDSTTLAATTGLRVKLKVRAPTKPSSDTHKDTRTLDPATHGATMTNAVTVPTEGDPIRYVYIVRFRNSVTPIADPETSACVIGTNINLGDKASFLTSTPTSSLLPKRKRRYAHAHSARKSLGYTLKTSPNPFEKELRIAQVAAVSSYRTRINRTHDSIFAEEGQNVWEEGHGCRAQTRRQATSLAPPPPSLSSHTCFRALGSLRPSYSCSLHHRPNLDAGTQIPRCLLSSAIVSRPSDFKLCHACNQLIAAFM